MVFSCYASIRRDHEPRGGKRKRKGEEEEGKTKTIAIRKYEREMVSTVASLQEPPLAPQHHTLAPQLW